MSRLNIGSPLLVSVGSALARNGTCGAIRRNSLGQTEGLVQPEVCVRTSASRPAVRISVRAAVLSTARHRSTIEPRP